MEGTLIRKIHLIGGGHIIVRDYKPVRDQEKGRGYLCSGESRSLGDWRRPLFFVPRKNVLYFEGEQISSEHFKELPQRFDEKMMQKHGGDRS